MKNLLRKRATLSLLLICSAIPALIAQQNGIPEHVKVRIKPGSLRSVFTQVQEQTPYSFAYNNEEIDRVTDAGIKQGEYRLETLLKTLGQKHHMNFKNRNGVIYVKRKTPKNARKVRGRVLDESGDPLPQTNVFEKGTANGVVTDMEGNFNIRLSGEDAVLTVSYMGYLTHEIRMGDRSTIDINLEPDASQLDEVVVTDRRNITEIKKPQMSVNRLSAEQIKRIPAVMGETDPLKSLLQLPGVTNAGEASSGFNVRGGAADQNLILLDGGPVFSDSHLFGFFSVFNADAIHNMDLYKGGIPSSFGGRVSSVLDVRQKTGNNQKFHMNGGIGLISSRLLAEGPLAKGKGSFLIAGRSSYAHLFLKLADNDNSAYFYDLNTKLNYRFNENNTLFLSAYFGRDVFKINKDFSSAYRNAMVNLQWKHDFSDDLSSALSVIYSDYRFGLELNTEDFTWDSTIETYTAKYDLKHYFSENFNLNYGAHATYYNFNPGTLKPDGEESSINFEQLDKKYALEPAFYIDAEHKLSEKLSVRYGLRYSMFYRYGEQDVNQYDDGRAVVFNPDFRIYEEGTPTGTRHYGSRETIASFNNLEPRLGISYALNDKTSVKASYNRMSQYLHLLSNTQSPTPLNIWTPSGPFIEPQLLDQVALGFFKNFKDDAYSLETEVFYKKVKNRIDYIDGADLIANNDIEQVILNGKARSYGLEVLLRKNTGRLTGWISYTLSRAEQKTVGRTPEETGINNGEWYLSPYDKLHNLSITGGYELNDKWSFGGSFTFQTGQPYTFPTGQYEIGGIMVPRYTSRNEDNLPSYHHLDVSATYIPKPKKKKGWQGEWVFSIYNLYSRKNSASINFQPNEDTGVNEAVRLSVFGIIPSVSYNFKF